MEWGLNLNIENEDNINWKNRYDFVIHEIDDFEYMKSKVKAKHVGSIFVSICPFPSHNEKTSSFTIYPKGYSKNGGPEQKYSSFYCFGCGEGGDVIKFKQLYDGLSSKKDACKALESEFNIKVDDENIRQTMLIENIESIKSTPLRTLDFTNINRICSNICKNYLNWVKCYHPNYLENEFKIIQKYYKYFDEQILDLTMDEAKYLINNTENIINERKNMMLLNLIT